MTEVKDTFEITSGKICVTDPCYKRGTWCAAWEVPAAKGKWNAVAQIFDDGETGGFGERVSKLVCYLDSEFMSVHDVMADTELEPFQAEIGVDSGQCGVFDFEQFPTDEQIEAVKDKDWNDPSHFYGKCCSVTLERPRFGSVGFGAVSSTGYGDGSYDLKVVYNVNGEVVAAVVTFIEKEEEDCEYDDEYSDLKEDEHDE